MQISIATILIALGGLGLITQRGWRVVLAALLVQWAGIVWQIAGYTGGTQGAVVEGVTAAASIAVLALSARSLSARQPDGRAALTDVLWLWAIALIAGIGGYGLARIYPFGGSESDALAFYWAALPAMLVLVVDGSRDTLKLGAGLLALSGTPVLLMFTLSASPPDTLALGLAALSRIGLAAIVTYAGLLIRTLLNGASLDTVFDLRDRKRRTETALMVITPGVPAAGAGEADLSGPAGAAVDADITGAGSGGPSPLHDALSGEEAEAEALKDTGTEKPAAGRPEGPSRRSRKRQKGQGTRGESSR